MLHHEFHYSETTEIRPIAMKKKRREEEIMLFQTNPHKLHHHVFSSASLFVINHNKPTKLHFVTADCFLFFGILSAGKTLSSVMWLSLMGIICVNVKGLLAMCIIAFSLYFYKNILSCM